MSEESNQNLTDVDAVLKELSGLDETIPPEVAEVDAGKDEAKGKAAHAFAELKRKAKIAVAAAESLKKEKADLEGKLKEHQTPPPPPTSAASKAVLDGLLAEARANLGLHNPVTQEDHALVAMEAQRIYSAKVFMLDSENRLRGTADSKIDEALARYPKLDDAGKAEVKKRLGVYPLSQRVDEGVIRNEVLRLLGEKYLEGEGGAEDEGDDGSSTAAARVAAARVSSRGRPEAGVRLGGRRSDGPAPATPEELSEMHKLGLNDLSAYREAKKHKDFYKGR